MGAMGLLGNVMMGVGGKVIDYAMQEGRLLREERMRELDRQFQSSEAQKGRDFTGSESEKKRAYDAEQAGIGREFDLKKIGVNHENSVDLAEINNDASMARQGASNAFQAEQADKTRSNGLLTKIEEDGSGRKYRVKADGSGVEYLDGVQGVDKRKKAAEDAASEVASSVIGKDSSMGNEDRYAKYTAVYNAEMEKRGYPQPKGASTPSPSSNVGNKTTIRTRAEYDALPSGSKYVAPDGSERTKP